MGVKNQNHTLLLRNTVSVLNQRRRRAVNHDNIELPLAHEKLPNGLQ